MYNSELFSINNELEDIEYYYYSNCLKRLENINKMKIFIHVPQERNERSWNSFYSRSNNELNLDICKLCIKSVIRKCDHNNFKIVIFNNSDIKDILNEEDPEDLCNVANPERLSGVDLKQWMQYCRTKILYKHGGIMMCPQFYFIKNITEHLFSNEFTILHVNNEGLNVSNKDYIPSMCYFMSAPKKDNNVKLYLKYLENLCIHQYSIDHKHFDKSFENYII